MKTRNIPALLALVVCATTLLLSACSKKDQATAPSAADAQRSADTLATDARKAAETMKAEAGKAATTVAGEAQKQAGEVKAAAETAAADAPKPTEAAAAQTQAQGLIDRAKGLVAEKKYTEALSSLNELSNLKLTTEQQKWMDELKAQIEKAGAGQAASGAAKSVGDLLKGEK